MLEVLRQVVGVRHPASKPFEKTLYIDGHAEYVILDPSLYTCDDLSLLPVEEKAVAGLPGIPQRSPQRMPMVSPTTSP